MMNDVPIQHTLIHKLGLLTTKKSTNCSEMVKSTIISASGDMINSVCCSINEELEEGEPKTAKTKTGTNKELHDFFIKAAQAISLTM